MKEYYFLNIFMLFQFKLSQHHLIYYLLDQQILDPNIDFRVLFISSDLIELIIKCFCDHPK